MSLPPTARMSQASGLAPPPSNYPQPLRGSSIFEPPRPTSATPSRPQSRVEPPPLSATAGPMPGTAQRPIHGPRKRLIVTCDGTWLDSDNGLMRNGQRRPPSNVSRIGWALKDTSRDGIPQVVHYQAGVGTRGGRISRLLGGAVGFGLKENVREAYTYLAINWREGDEIFLMGFSRGAFTARSVGGMIGALGLLTRSGLALFSEIFEDWEHRYDKSYVSQSPEWPFPGKGPFDDHYVRELERRGLTKLNVPIKAICCWDTVGSLGIPRVPVLEMLRLQTRSMHAYQFYDTRLSPCVENAFQALALDERRRPFMPAVWEKRENDPTILEQVWFPGVHSNVGSGYIDQDLGDITLAWMMSRLEGFLDFRPDFLIQCWEDNRAYYKSIGQKTKWWSFGEIYNSLTGFYSVTGSKTRTPGDYYRSDPITGNPTSKRLRNTHEYIHSSVRSRLGMQGPGSQDRGLYEPRALKDWTFDVERLPPGQGGNPGGNIFVWTDRSGSRSGGQDKIREAPLKETEVMLLRQSPRVEKFVREMRDPTKDKRRSRRMDDDPAAEDDFDEPRRHRRNDADGAIDGGNEGRRSRRDPDRDRKRRSRRYDGSNQP